MYKNIALVCYPESCNIDESIEKIKHNLVYYAYILHDKDLENNKQKKPHYHVVLSFINGTSKKQVAKVFNVNEELVQKLGNLYGNIRYMLHLSEIGKHVYDFNEIVTYNLDRDLILSKVKSIISNDNDILNDIINFIYNGEYPTNSEILRYVLHLH